MNQQNNNDYEVYTVQNVRYALTHSTVPGVLTLVLNEPVHVRASEWKACLVHISELCGTKWVTKIKLKVMALESTIRSSRIGSDRMIGLSASASANTDADADRMGR
ncbi:hypothetical protein BDC45DRAFT_593814 [Circinella umbellata]|nr:hypothetical protein BDC45DRAFT_593814 [Circinella umbellata]